MANFKELAKKSVTLAEIMEKREKIDTEEIIKEYKDGFEIDEIEYVTIQKEDGKTDQFWAFHIKGTDKFAFAGLVLGKIFETYLEAYEGDYEALYQDFNGKESIAVKLESSTTKSSKRPVTIVKVL